MQGEVLEKPTPKESSDRYQEAEQVKGVGIKTRRLARLLSAERAQKQKLTQFE
jgi:hypothetical protein